MRDQLLPKACCINLIEWKEGEFDINTDTFDGMTEGVEFTGNLSYLLETPIDFKITMTPRKNVSSIIDEIQNIYRLTCENSLEEDYYSNDLIISSIIADTDTKTIEIEFLR